MGGVEGDFEGHGDELKLRVGLDPGEDLIERRFEGEPLVADQHGNFEQGDGTQGQRHSVANGRFHAANLVARELLPVMEPA